MLILTVLALGSLVSAEDGYHYDVPRAPINQPGSVVQEHPVKSISFTLSDKANLPQSFKPASIPTYTHNNYAQSINLGPKVNDGLNTVSTNPTFNNEPGQNFNISPSFNINLPNTGTNINHLTPNTGQISGANINSGPTNLASQNSLNKLVSSVVTNMNNGYSNIESFQTNLHNGLVRNSNTVVNSNVYSNTPIQGINTKSGYYSQSTSHNSGSNSYTSGFSANFNSEPANNVQYNTENTQKTYKYESSTYNSRNSINLDNSLASQNNKEMVAQLYPANNRVNAIAEILMPPFQNSPNTGILPLQNTNNVNTNSFPPTSSGDNGISQPTTKSGSAINNAVHNMGITNGMSSQTAPIVMKSIYFHVPPPDIEEPIGRSVPPPPLKKSYKIVIIKVPSHRTSANSVRLQQLAQQKTQVDIKTLIYVLVRKPESAVSLVPPQTTKADHEVFFVKYQSRPEEIPSQINGKLAERGSTQSIVPMLQPGLGNGQRHDDELRGDQGTL